MYFKKKNKKKKKGCCANPQGSGKRKEKKMHIPLAVINGVKIQSNRQMNVVNCWEIYS